jgi:hypothetical protein
MPSSSEKTVVRARTPPVALRISHWPLRDEPWRSGMILGIVSLISAICGAVTGSWGMAVAVFTGLNLTVIRLWIPVHYEFGPRGITYSWFGHPRRIAWSDVGRFEVRADGVVLYGDSQPHSLAALRSLFIRWNGKRDELSEILDRFLAQEPATSSSSTGSFHPDT